MSMAAPEQTTFQIPSIQERDDLVLADAAPEIRPARTGSIASIAERAAVVAATVLSVDKQGAEDTFTGQLEAMGESEIASDLVPVVHVTVGSMGQEGGAWTPSHVIRGHDALRMEDTVAVPETSVWPKMYANRPPAWWNKTRSNGESELIEAPLQVVLADLALRGTRKNWNKQQAELDKLIGSHKSESTTLEGMSILSWVMMDADAIIGGAERPDKHTVTRFIQHEMDRSVDDWSDGPGANVLERRARLFWSHGHAYPRFGFRAVVGQKKTA